MAELAFLAAVRDALAAAPLVPAVPLGHVGVVDPVAAADLPAVVLSLDTTARVRVGLGERSELVTGALPARTTVGLANATLPDDPGFSLVDGTRTLLTLFHGGQVHADGSEATTPLEPADVRVTLDGAPLSVVPGAPNAGEVQADPIAGQLRFGTPLPNAGTVVADYFLGQWERRVERATGTLRVDACAATGAEAASLGDAVVTRLLEPEAVPSASLGLVALSSVELVPARPDPPAAAVVVAQFRRRAAFAFDFTRLVDRADSSGGIIRRIPITARLEARRVDRRTGAVITEIVVEQG
jgi:hypothetical protein